MSKCSVRRVLSRMCRLLSHIGISAQLLAQQQQGTWCRQCHEGTAGVAGVQAWHYEVVYPAIGFENVDGAIDLW